MMRREQFSPDKTVSIVSQKQHGAQTKGKNYSWNKMGDKSVQLVRGSFLLKYFLQNPFPNGLLLEQQGWKFVSSKSK